MIHIFPILCGFILLDKEIETGFSGEICFHFGLNAERTGSSKEQKHVRRPASKSMDPSLEKALLGEADFVEK